MVRVLQVVTYMGVGGLENMLMNYYRNIDRDKIQFDFLTHRYEIANYDKEIQSLGGRIYHLPKLNPFSKNYLNTLDEFFKEHKEYKIVHCHQDCLSGVVLKYAKKNNVPFTIAHAHSSNQDKNLKYLIKLLAKKNIKKYSDELFACSNSAGKWMFNTNDFKILNNAIDIDLYTYNKEKALTIKQKLGIQDKFVVGHVGSFSPPKNHKFIIDIFNEIQKQNKNSILLLIGNGEGSSEIEKKVESLGISEKVKFMGLRSDVNNLMQSMDVLLFPSLYEGLPLTLVEAQASGLKCVISDKVPLDCKMTENIEVVKLEESPQKWAEEVLKYQKYERKNTKEEIVKANFDIKANAKYLQEFYLNKC